MARICAALRTFQKLGRLKRAFMSFIFASICLRNGVSYAGCAADAIIDCSVNQMNAGVSDGDERPIY